MDHRRSSISSTVSKSINMIKIAVICLLATIACSHPVEKHGYGHGHGYAPAHGYGYGRVHGYGYAPAPVKVIKVQKVEKVDKVEPYEFSYDITDEDHNSQSRKESGDAHGNMEGSYGITLADGRKRWVVYWADENGFRAKIDTNEPGTDAQNPADVEMNADPIEIKEAPKKVIKKVIVAPSYGYATHGYGYGHHGY